MNHHVYQKGEVVFRQGDESHTMFEIQSGRIGIFANYQTPKEKQLAVFEKGETFGEMGMIENLPRSATAVALEDDTAADEINSAEFSDYFEQDPVKVFMILQQLSQRLRKTTGDYLEVCHAICDVTDQPENAPMDPALQARLLAIQNEYMMLNMSGLRFY